MPTVEHRATTETTESLEPRLGVSMLSLVDLPTAYLTLCPIYTYQKAVGPNLFLEYWPINYVPNLQVKTKLVTRAELEQIQTAHTSYRSEKNLKQSWNHPNRRLAIRAYFALPYINDLSAVGTLAEKIRKSQGRELPVVGYPATPRGTFEQTGITHRLVQPTPELFERMDAKDARDFLEKLKALGFTGLCFDTLHSRFLFRQRKLEQVIHAVQLVHLSFGRQDIIHQGFEIDAPAEASDVLHGHKKIEFWDVIRQLIKLGYKGPFVIETPFEVIRTSLGHKAQILTPRKIAAVYEQVNDSLASVIV